MCPNFFLPIHCLFSHCLRFSCYSAYEYRVVFFRSRMGVIQFIRAKFQLHPIHLTLFKKLPFQFIFSNYYRHHCKWIIHLNELSFVGLLIRVSYCWFYQHKTGKNRRKKKKQQQQNKLSMTTETHRGTSRYSNSLHNQTIYRKILHIESLKTVSLTHLWDH